jgi:hypothetical protein
MPDTCLGVNTVGGALEDKSSAGVGLVVDDSTPLLGCRVLGAVDVGDEAEGGAVELRGAGQYQYPEYAQK